MSEIKKLFQEYLDYLEIEKNRSLKTRENYSHYLTVFLKETGVETPGEITDSVVRSFRITLARKNIKKITQNYYVISLRNFLKYLVRRGIKSLAPETIELPKVARRDIEVLEYKELERLLAAPE